MREKERRNERKKEKKLPLLTGEVQCYLICQRVITEESGDKGEKKNTSEM